MRNRGPTKGDLLLATSGTGATRVACVLLLAMTVFVHANSATAGQQGIVVELEPVEGNSVPQGAPFRFRLIVENTTGGAATPTVMLDVAPAGDPGGAIPFHIRTGYLGGNSSERTILKVTPAQWFEELGPYEVSVGGNDFDSTPLTFTVDDPVVRVPRFNEIASDRGITNAVDGAPPCGDHSAGAAWADVDRDGDLDLYVPHRTNPAQLWVNNDGHFTDEAAGSGVLNTGSIGIGAVFADYDNDGDADLYVINNGANRLYKNDGSGQFTDVTGSAGVGNTGAGSSASWGDYDGDGWLDLYVANWGWCDEEETNLTYSPDVLYHNEGDGSFTNSTSLLTETGSVIGAGFQAAWLDYDRDGDQDLYLGNDFIGAAPVANELWRNDGEGTGGDWVFTNVSVTSGSNLSMATMGLAVGDYDRDLDLDIGMSNIESSRLLRNEGNGTFVERGAYARLARPSQRANQKSVTWGTAFQDFNNDGWEDIYFAGGRIPNSHPQAQADALFVNGRDGRFLDFSAPSGASDLGTSRGVAFADFDRDGRMDFYVANQEELGELYRNKTPARNRHWLEVDTVGRASNRDGCGAVLILKTRAGNRLMRQVFCGSVSLGSGSDPTVHFGLGKAKNLSSLKIEWPSGKTQTLTSPEVDRLLRVREPMGP